MKKFLVMVLVFQFLTIPLYPVLQVSEVYAQPVRDQYYKEEPQQPVYEPEPEPEPEYQAPNVEENITPTYYPPARRYDPPPVYEPEYEPEPEWVPEQEEAPAAETEQPGGQEAATPAVKTAYQVCLEENPGSGYCDAIFYGIGQPANEPGVFNEGSPAVAETSGGNSGSWWDTVTQWPADAWEWAKDTAEETGQSIAEVVAGTGDRIADMFGGGDEETASDSNSETPSVGPQPQDPEWAGKIEAADASWKNYLANALSDNPDPEAVAAMRAQTISVLGLPADSTDDQVLAFVSQKFAPEGVAVGGTVADMDINAQCLLDPACAPDLSVPSSAALVAQGSEGGCDAVKAIRYVKNANGSLAPIADLSCRPEVTDTQARLELFNAAVLAQGQSDKAESDETVNGILATSAEALLCSSTIYASFNREHCDAVFKKVASVGLQVGSSIIASGTSSNEFLGGDEVNAKCQAVVRGFVNTRPSSADAASRMLDSEGCQYDERSDLEREAALREAINPDSASAPDIQAGLAQAGLPSTGWRATKIQDIANELEFDLKNPNADPSKRDNFIARIIASDPEASTFIIENVLGVPLTAFQNQAIARQICDRDVGREVCALGIYDPQARINQEVRPRGVYLGLSDDEISLINAEAKALFPDFQPSDPEQVKKYAQARVEAYGIFRGNGEYESQVRKQAIAQIMGMNVDDPELAGFEQTYNVWNATADQILADSSAGKTYGKAVGDTQTQLLLGVGGLALDAPDLLGLGVAGFMIARKALPKLVGRNGIKTTEEAAEYVARQGGRVVDVDDLTVLPEAQLAQGQARPNAEVPPVDSGTVVSGRVPAEEAADIPAAGVKTPPVVQEDPGDQGFLASVGNRIGNWWDNVTGQSDEVPAGNIAQAPQGRVDDVPKLKADEPVIGDPEPVKVDPPAAPKEEPTGEVAAPAPKVDETPVAPDAPTQIADAPTLIRPEEPNPVNVDLPCAASLPAGFQLIKEVYAQDGDRRPCRIWDPRDWGEIADGWFGRNQPARIPDSPTKNQTDELAQIEPVDLDPSPAGPIADIPDQASGIGTRAEGPVIADKPLVTFQDDFAARLKEKFPDGGDVEIGPPRPYSEGSSDTYISKNEGQVLLWTADQSDGGLPPIVKNVSSTAPRGSKAGTQVVDAWEQTMADKGYRVVGANNVETRIPQGQSAVRVQDGDKVLELTPAEAFWWGRGYRPYLEGERNSNKLWVKPLTPEGQESIDIARRLAQQSNNPYVDFTRYLDSTPKLSESKVADEVVAQLSPSSTHDEIRVVLAEKGYLDREADELAYQVRQRLAESNSGSRADVLGLERNEITQVAGPDTPGIKPAVQAPASQFDEYGQLIVPQRSWWEDAVSIVTGLTSYAGDAIENGWWRQGILARMFGEQDTSQITPKLENLRTRLGQSREVRVDENGKLVFDPPSTPAVPGTNQADELAGRADAPGAGGVEPDSQAGRAGPDAPAPKDEPPLLPCNISIRDWAGPNVLGTSRGPQVLAVTNGGAPCPVRAAVGAVLDGPVGGAVPLAWRASLESTASLIDGLVRRSQELGNSLMNRVRGNSSGPTRVQGVRGNKAFEAVLETYGNKPGVTEDLFPRYDDGTGGKTMVNLKPGDAGHLLSAKYPDSERIILLTPGEVLKLEEGKHYNYIITSDKRIFIIERRNGMEIGEKHQQLAGELWKLDKVTAEAIANKNVGVVMAGEARVENGALLMDLQSGTFSRISDNKGFKGVWASGQGELSNLEDVVEGVTGIRPLAVRQVDVRKRNAVEFELDKEAAAKRSIDAPVGSSNRLVALNNRMQEWIDDHPNATKTIGGVLLGVSAGVVLGVPFIVAFGRSGSAAPRLSSTAIPATSNTADETDRSGDEETTANASNQMGQIPSNSNVDPFLPSSQDLDGKVSVVPVSKNPSAESAKKVDDIMDDFKNIVPKESRVPACAGLDSVLANIWEDGRYDIIKNYGQVPGECLNPLPDGSQCEKGKVVNNTYTQCGGSIGLENQEFGVNYDITRTIRCEESNGKIEARIAYSEPKVSSEKGVCQEKSEQKYSRDLGESCSFDAECKGLAECDSQVKVCRQRGEIRKYENGLDSKGYDDCVGLAATMKAQKNPVRGIEYACHQDNKNSGFNNKRVQIYVMDSEALNICMIKILDLGQGVNCPKP